MGLYSIAIDQKGRRYQFHGGGDSFCEEFRIGDSVAEKIKPWKNYPGHVDFGDSLYDAYSEDDSDLDSVVVISGAKVVAIEPRPDPQADEFDKKMDALRVKHDIHPPPRKWWSEKEWDKYEAEGRASEEERQSFENSLIGLTPKEVAERRKLRFLAGISGPIRLRIGYAELMKKVVTVEPIEQGGLK